MWEKTEKARKSQRWSFLLAVLILVGLLITFPLGGGFADYMNATNAPVAESTRYTEADGWTGVDFNMDTTAFKNSGSYRCKYIWKNASGYLNYNNVSHTAGVISVTDMSTAGNKLSIPVNGTSNVSWATMHPEMHIWFDYTAKQAYDDNVVRIRLYIGNIYVAGNAKARTITLTAGGQTFFTTTLAQTDTDAYIDENITVTVNELRRAIIDSGELSYFKLVLTAQDTTLTIANSAMYTYHVTKLTDRDEGLIFVGGIGCAIAFAGIFLVQPKYSLPLGDKGTRKGGF